jgi:hypothetical protein
MRGRGPLYIGEERGNVPWNIPSLTPSNRPSAYLLYRRSAQPPWTCRHGLAGQSWAYLAATLGVPGRSCALAGPFSPIFCELVDLFVSFPWTGGLPKMESGCILGIHFTRACSCSPRWIWTRFWAFTSWVHCWAF